MLFRFVYATTLNSKIVIYYFIVQIMIGDCDYSIIYFLLFHCCELKLWIVMGG